MNGQPQARWTEGRHHWLRTVRGQGSKPTGKGSGPVAQYCRYLGWTTVDLGSRLHKLTPAGQATLERWEAGERTAEKRPSGAGLMVSGWTPAELADKLVAMGGTHARKVYEALHVALGGELPERDHDVPVGQVCDDHHPVKRYHDGGLVGLPDRDVPRIIDAGQVVPTPQPEPEPIAQDPTGTPGHPLASLGTVVHQSKFLQCPRCNGKGTAGHFTCHRCQGNGTITRGTGQ